MWLDVLEHSWLDVVTTVPIVMTLKRNSFTVHRTVPPEFL